MKKSFQPLEIEIVWFDETDVMTVSKPNPNTGPVIPAAMFNPFDDDFI